MKAIIYDGYGDESVLRLAEVPDPKLPADRVLIRVKAAGVNPVDAHVRAGVMDGMLDAWFPVVPGWDVAGVVEAVGYTSTAFAPGDEVMGYAWMDYLRHGSYAELLAAPIRTLAPKPARASWEEAAALPLAGLTAYQAIQTIKIGSGATVLVHGAAGGVGSIGAQIARILGARVIGTASEANHDFLRDLGIEPVTYDDDMGDQVRGLAPDGVDAVLDYGGRGSLLRSTDLLAPGVGMEQVVTAADGVSAREVGARVIGVRPDAAALAQLGAWVDEGSLTVHVREVLPLAEAAEAHRRVMTGHGRGKIVLSVS